MITKIYYLVLSIILSNLLYAQSINLPFSTVHISAGVSKVNLSEPLNSYWIPKYSFVIEAEFPFYVGEVGTG
ncbi:MAG: hypothetical protein N3A61_03225, partial [Ignavibacteria bacterium]|nr:hypothetical protein [Ignavibacteria bacterium]